MQSKERFLKALRCENSDRPPVWLMRQAGRYLPEYQAIRAQHGFIEMLTNDELITEISLQPWRRFQMDAVIVFSDILLLPMVMGMDLKFIEGQGPKFSKLIASEEDLEGLKPFDKEKIAFLINALKQIKNEIKSDAALIGFAGSPWTVASYMMQSSKNVGPTPFLQKLLERLTKETIFYLQAKIEAGVDCIQIFDSWGGTLSPEEYAIWSAPYIKDIVTALKPTDIPIILYVKESEPLLDLMVGTGCDVISVGWETPLSRAKLYNVAIQGNFNPHILMQATPQEIRSKTKDMLQTMKGYAGYIANLGHGVLPKTPVENVAAFVETVQKT
ncbi:MAG: uroporphyrinogen decarboxylase [Deltaproteobacteria bacterium RIFCSPLOWO2_01_44_7]|nr:MAG: uroporphyrinogen decarboxylase [Deltaproteobacteria bacterium RIFCSPHIGHO2_01_FULL_43_49]OGQ16713.1 MAG: uroporphyrinogen decarboxylase [Deltaproteobacteria bacterium RIFCSPHIGHO2_02_FULL_44_53]OGQ29851.1 MAG: uroporphyrinogen decarboxylase [Deltaproteobacteria bacterium RIFCSPHIGHO2_12_FULL_44_21]OGQ33141.1 MAG: uroporphyrinogen decarboxylase [Deltaproteobacteria bacterium RIFCSPLOWO2_01_FULL_45_74]OGQ41507.1 MAG: uroporphyrinogen decarboxylase [Deltaproteobacteria bacterium RIFCSPLOWO